MKNTILTVRRVELTHDGNGLCIARGHPGVQFLLDDRPVLTLTLRDMLNLSIAIEEWGGNRAGATFDQMNMVLLGGMPEARDLTAPIRE